MRTAAFEKDGVERNVGFKDLLWKKVMFSRYVCVPSLEWFPQLPILINNAVSTHAFATAPATSAIKTTRPINGNTFATVI